MAETLIGPVPTQAALSILRFRRPRPRLRFYDSVAAGIWAHLENQSVTVIPVRDMEALDYYLRHVSHEYRRPLPWLILHIDRVEPRIVPPNEIILSMTAASGFALCRANTSLSIADAIIAVACELRAEAVCLTRIRSRSSLLACWLRRLIGLETDVAFDVAMQLRMLARTGAHAPHVLIWSRPEQV